MPVSITFVTPTGKLKKETIKNGQSNKNISEPFENVVKNSGGKFAYMESVEISTESLVVRGAEEILGVIDCSATVFQWLVSRTPIDEEYDYVNINKLREMIQSSSGEEDFDIKDVIEHHKPDNDRIRDNWRIKININGKVAIDISAKDFPDETFEVENDSNSISKIRTEMCSQFNTSFNGKDNGYAYDYNVVFINNSDHFSKLEYGGYKKSKNGIKQGKKYQHGVGDDGFSIQAPNGFYRRTLLTFNAMLNNTASNSRRRNVSRKLQQYYVGSEKSKTKKFIEKQFQRFDPVKQMRSKNIDIKFDDLKLGEIITDLVKMSAKDDELRLKIIANNLAVKTEFGRHVGRFENIISFAETNTKMTASEFMEEIKNKLGDQYDIPDGAIIFYGTGKKFKKEKKAITEEVWFDKKGKLHTREGQMTVDASYYSKKSIEKQKIMYQQAREDMFNGLIKEKGLTNISKNTETSAFSALNKKYSTYSKKYPSKIDQSFKNYESNLETITLVGKTTGETVYIKKIKKENFLSESGFKKLLADEMYKKNKGLYKKRKNVGNFVQYKINRRRKRRSKK